MIQKLLVKLRKPPEKANNNKNDWHSKRGAELAVKFRTEELNTKPEISSLIITNNV